jgi:VWFA-related protein
MRLVLTFALALSASAPPSNPEAALATTTLDVVVEDARGQAIETLGPADFSVTEPTGPLTIDAVRFVHATGTATGGLAAPINSPAEEVAAVADTRRLIAIFLDEFHVTPGSGADRVREALVRFVKEDLGPDDLIVVLKPLDSLLDIRLTRDRSAAIHAIESFDPRRGDYAPRTTFERNFIAGAPARIESARAQIAASSLDALATHLGQFSPARKTLIVVSEGFARSMRRRGDDLLPSVESVVAAANRAHVSIYPIEPLSGPPSDLSPDGPTRDAAEEARLRDALRLLAEGTAGRATAAADDLAVGLRRVLRDASGYYVLTLSRGDAQRDGRFHPVDVAIRRPGLTARVRQGYWAPSDEDKWRAAVSAASVLPFASQFPRRTSPLIRPWFGMSRGDDGATRVSFVWEPAPRVPGDRNPAPAPARIGLSVTTLDGHPVFEGVVLPSDTGLFDPNAVRQSRASFESPAGRLLVQMAIEDATARVVDRDVRDLVVGGFPGPVTIGSSEVFRARNAREYNVLASDPDAAPVASRQFSRTERLLIRVPVFSTGGAPVVSARLVSGFGGAMRDLAVSPVASRATQYLVDLPLAALAVGAYTVELSARTPDGEAKDSLSFRVTP